MSKTERALETDEVDDTLDLDRFVTSEVEEADRAIDGLIDGANGSGNGSGGNGNGHSDPSGDMSVPTGFGVMVDDVTGEIERLDGVPVGASDGSVPTGILLDDAPDDSVPTGILIDRASDGSVPTGVVLDEPVLPPILADDDEPVDLAEMAMPGGLVDDTPVEADEPVDLAEMAMPGGLVDDTPVEADEPVDLVDEEVPTGDLPTVDELGAHDSLVDDSPAVDETPVHESSVVDELVEPDVSVDDDLLIEPEVEAELADADTDVVDLVDVDETDEAELVDETDEADADLADADLTDAELVDAEIDDADLADADAELEVAPDVEADDHGDTEVVDVVEVDSDVGHDGDTEVVDVVEVDPNTPIAIEPDGELDVAEVDADADVDVDADVVAVVPGLDEDIHEDLDGDGAPYVLPVIVPATGDDPAETDEADVEDPVEAREGDLDEEVSDDIIEELRRADIDGPVVDFAPQDDTTSARRAPKRRPDYDPAPMPIPARPPRVLGRKPRVRKVTRVVQHVDPWTVFKIAIVAFLVLYVVLLVAGVLLWNVAYATGTIDNIERFFESFGWSSFEFNGGEIYHAAWIAGLFGVIGLTGMAVLTATLFNLITDIVGGMRFTVLEEEVVETRTSPMRRFVVRRPEPEVPAVIPDPTGDPSGTIIREAIVDDSGAIEKRA